MKILGYLFTFGGLLALIVSLVNYINESESFSFMGLDVAVSKGDPVPMIISAVIFIAGLLIVRAAKE